MKKNKLSIILVAALLLSGCSKSADNETEQITAETIAENKETIAESQPETEEPIEVLREIPEVSFCKYIDEKLVSASQDMPYDFNNFYNSFDYKIISTTTDGDSAELCVEITCHDLSTLMEDVATEVFVQSLDYIFSDEEFDTTAASEKLIDEKLNALEYPETTKSINVYMNYNDDKWEISDGKNCELLSALVGGMMPPESFEE